MKRFLVLISVLSISVCGFAQKKGPSFIGISGGISLPTGNWSKSTEVVDYQGFTYDKNGYAKMGGTFSVEGAWFFSKNLGIGGMFSYASYGLKIDSLSQGYQESFDVDQVTTTASRYKMWSIMPGLFFNEPLQSKLAFTSRVLLGLTHATTPDIAVDVEDGGIDDGTFHQESANKTAFSFDVGVGLKYNITKLIALNLGADYFYSKPDFTIQNTNRKNSAGRLVDEYNQPLASVNISLGVAYVFGRK